MVQQEPMRRFATAVHEDTDPSEESEGDSEDDVDEAMSIAPSDALSKMAGSSNTPTRKIQITPPLALRTRGKTRAPETKKPTSQATPRLSTSKPPSTQKGTTIKGKIPSLLERGRSSSPQPATQRPAPGPIRTSRPVGPAAHDSDVELSEFQTTEFRNLPYYKQLKLRIAHQNARHTQLLNQTLAQLVSSNQKMTQQLEYVTARQDTFQKMTRKTGMIKPEFILVHTGIYPSTTKISPAIWYLDTQRQ